MKKLDAMALAVEEFQQRNQHELNTKITGVDAEIAGCLRNRGLCVKAHSQAQVGPDPLEHLTAAVVLHRHGGGSSAQTLRRPLTAKP